MKTIIITKILRSILLKQLKKERNKKTSEEQSKKYKKSILSLTYIHLKTVQQNSSILAII